MEGVYRVLPGFSRSFNPGLDWVILLSFFIGFRWVFLGFYSSNKEMAIIMISVITRFRYFFFCFLLFCFFGFLPSIPRASLQELPAFTEFCLLGFSLLLLPSGWIK